MAVAAVRASSNLRQGGDYPDYSILHILQCPTVFISIPVTYVECPEDGGCSVRYSGIPGTAVMFRVDDVATVSDCLTGTATCVLVYCVSTW